jgi:hypothetical protein
MNKTYSLVTQDSSVQEQEKDNQKLFRNGKGVGKFTVMLSKFVA